MRISDWSSDVCSSDLGHSYLRIVVAQLAHADIGMEAMEAQLQELREQYVEQLSRMFPAVPRNRIEEVPRACVSIAAAMPIQLKPEALNKQKIDRSEEQTSELQSLMSTSYAVFCLKK